jgi:hypothetical protein
VDEEMMIAVATSISELEQNNRNIYLNNNHDSSNNHNRVYDIWSEEDSRDTEQCVKLLQVVLSKLPPMTIRNTSAEELDYYTNAAASVGSLLDTPLRTNHKDSTNSNNRHKSNSSNSGNMNVDNTKTSIEESNKQIIYSISKCLSDLHTRLHNCIANTSEVIILRLN